MPRLRKIEVDDLDFISENLTDINRREIQAMVGLTVKEWYNHFDIQ